MSAAADTKPKAGDLLLLRRSQAGSSSGLHWAVEVNEGGVIVETLTGGWSQRFTAPFEDIAGIFRNAASAADMTLDPRPEAKVVAAAPAPEQAPRMVKIHVISASKDGYEITRSALRSTLLNRHNQVTTRYRATRVALVDGAGQSHSEFLVDSRDVDKFLGGVPGSYRSDRGLRNQLAPQFSEDS